MANAIGLIKSSIWSDADFTALSGDAQRMYLFLLTQEDIDLCGRIHIRPALWADAAAGLTAAKVKKCLTELEAARFILTDRKTEELLVRTFVRHSGALKIPNVVLGLTRHYATIRSEALRRAVLDQLPDGLMERIGERVPERFATEYRNRSANPSADLRAPISGTVPVTVSGTLPATVPDVRSDEDPHTALPPYRLTAIPTDEVNVGGISLVGAQPASRPPIAPLPDLRQAMASGSKARLAAGVSS